MIKEITANEKCFGCSACASICPKEAIIMIEREKGFFYPEVKESCIECKLCIQTCPANSEAHLPKPLSVSAAKNKDTKTLNESTSGGVFSLLARNILMIGGSVYGVAYDKNIVAKHIRITSMDGLNSLRGSKYVQSRIGDSFNQVHRDLQAGRQVLFSGTSCQCDGLIRFLKSKNADTSLLLTVAVVCHGVPSPRLFKDHIAFIERERNKKIANYKNREKIHGWHEHNECIYYSDGTKEWRTKITQNFKDLFYLNAILRESCYTCPYAEMPTVSDITIGDFWGIEYLYPKQDDNNGMSLVFANSDKGKKCIEETEINCRSFPITAEEALKYNHHSACKRPKCTDDLWNGYYKYGFGYIVQKYASYTAIGRAKWRIKQELRRILVILGVKRG